VGGVAIIAGGCWLLGDPCKPAHSSDMTRGDTSGCFAKGAYRTLVRCQFPPCFLNGYFLREQSAGVNWHHTSRLIDSFMLTCSFLKNNAKMRFALSTLKRQEEVNINLKQHCVDSLPLKRSHCILYSYLHRQARNLCAMQYGIDHPHSRHFSLDIHSMYDFTTSICTETATRCRKETSCAMKYSLFIGISLFGFNKINLNRNSIREGSIACAVQNIGHCHSSLNIQTRHH